MGWTGNSRHADCIAGFNARSHTAARTTMTVLWTLFIGLAGYAIGRITTTVRLRQEIKELGESVWRYEQSRP